MKELVFAEPGNFLKNLDSVRLYYSYITKKSEYPI